MEHYRIELCNDENCKKHALQIIEDVFIYKAINNESETVTKELYFIAFADSEQTGAAKVSIFDNKAELSAIAVLPLFQRQGVGRDLIKAIFAETRKYSERLELSSPSSSRAFFYSAGFKEDGTPYLFNNTAYQKMFIELVLE